MGVYLNPGNEGFQIALNSEIYVDKTGLIRYTNSVINSGQRNICVSRPRRFGKSMAVDMLIAYYSRGCSSEKMFLPYEISSDNSFIQHLNCHNVIFMNIQRFLSRADSAQTLVDYLQQEVLKELKEEYGDCVSEEEMRLAIALETIYSKTQKGFIFIIDEWDCIFREKQHDTLAQTRYLDFMRDLFKDQIYVDLVYMTGILPIKKYGTHSALNIFDEFSMTEASLLAEYAGFTEKEVRMLCEQYHTDYSDMKQWYDGYCLGDGMHIYNPKSVVDALRRKKISSYWTKTETYEALKVYIDMNFDGLKDSVIKMLGGGHCHVDTGTFQNDMTTFESRDDVLTLLVHLGYLTYDADTEEVMIPNEEVRAEFARAIKQSGWNDVINAIKSSEQLMQAVLGQNEVAVAKGIDDVHMDTTSVLSYNDENSLSCVISLAFYSAKKDYILIREFPTGKGFADMVFLPRRTSNNPALIIELKWDKSVVGALEQIREKKYIRALENYSGEMLLVAINYDKSTKKHQCRIESYIYKK